MNHRRAIVICLLAVIPVVTGIYLFVTHPRSSGQFQSSETGSTGSGQTGAAFTGGTASGNKSETGSSTGKIESPDQLVAGLCMAVARKDQAAIDRYIEAIQKAGASCILPLRDSLVKENDAETARTLVGALTRIPGPEAYAAAMEASTLTENKDTKYVILDSLKDTLNEESGRYLVKIALSGSGSVPVAAIDLISSSGNSGLLASLVNSASTQQERVIAADVLRNSRNPGSAWVLEECAMLPDDLLAKAAVAGLAGQSSVESVKLLLNSFNDYGPAPNPARFQVVVDGLQTLLAQNTEKPVLADAIESLMTNSDSSVTRAAAVAALSSNSSPANKVALAQTFKKALQVERDPQVRFYLEQSLRKIQPGQ